MMKQETKNPTDQTYRAGAQLISGRGNSRHMGSGGEYVGKESYQTAVEDGPRRPGFL